MKKRNKTQFQSHIYKKIEIKTDFGVICLEAFFQVKVGEEMEHKLRFSLNVAKVTKHLQQKYAAATFVDKNMEAWCKQAFVIVIKCSNEANTPFKGD